MRFSAIEAVLPSRRVTNDEVIEHIIHRSGDSLSPKARLKLARAFESMWALAGTQVRYWRSEQESAFELACQAGRAALASAKMDPKDIDLIIYVGVGRGFLEPASANIFQDALKLERATGFDLLDACASWLRALHLVHTLIRAGQYKNVMILNAEFNQEFANPHFKAVSELRHNFATFTVGDATTATIVSATDQDSGYHGTFRTWGGLRNLCMIPLPHLKSFNGETVPENSAPLTFISYSTELFMEGVTKLVEHYHADPRIKEFKPDIAFGHAASDLAARQVAIECNQDPELYFYTHGRFANTVSASVPLAMYHARKEGRLRPDNNVLIGVASAGLTTAWSKFKFIA